MKMNHDDGLPLDLDADSIDDNSDQELDDTVNAVSAASAAV